MLFLDVSFLVLGTALTLGSLLIFLVRMDGMVSSVRNATDTSRMTAWPFDSISQHVRAECELETLFVGDLTS